jgi:hypothetical protein
MRQLRGIFDEGSVVLGFVEVQMAAVFGVVEHLLRFTEHAGRQRPAAFDRSLGRKKVEFFPIFPRLERFVGFHRGVFDREADAVALVDMETGYQHARSLRVVRPVFPEGAGGSLVIGADS